MLRLDSKSYTLLEIPRCSRRGFFIDSREVSEDYEVAVVFADIFRFKNLNCSLGHFAGDEVMLAVTDAIKSGTRTNEIACRYGGDEFLIILPNVTQNEVAERAEELREAVEKTPLILGGKHETYVILSIGVAHGLSKSSDSKLRGAESLMRDAEAKLMRDRQRNVERLRNLLRAHPAN